ncbi:hypothetical protein BH10BDE1_BH10BDE1_30330 [soil metagenome]
MRTLSTLALFVFAATASIFSSNAGAQTTVYPNTERCVMVFVKEDVSQANLTLACDGNRLIEKLVPRESDLLDAAQYKTSLYAEFQAMVNADGKKVCNEYDMDGVWWAACLLP